MENIIYSILTAICFAIWPILVNKSGSPNTSASTIWVMIGSILPLLCILLGQQKLSLPTKHIGIALVIGLINGLGMCFYTKIISTPQPGLYVSIVATIIPIVALILGFLIMGQPIITGTKVIGMMVVVIGIWLIVK